MQYRPQQTTDNGSIRHTAQHSAPAYARHRRSSRRQPQSALAWVIIAALAAIAVPLAIFAAVMLFASPAELLRDELVRQVERKTGHELKIAQTSIVATPAPGVILSGLTVAARGGTTEPAFKARQIRFDLALLPMLQGRIAVRNAEIVEPDLNLASRLVADRLSAQLRRPRASNAKSARRTGHRKSKRKRRRWRLFKVDLFPRLVTVRNGAFRLAPTARRLRRGGITDANVTISTSAPGELSLIAGRAKVNGRPAEVAGTVDSFAKLSARESAAIRLTAKDGLTTIGFNGTATAGKDWSITGTARVTAASFDAFLGTSGPRRGKAGPDGPVSVIAKVAALPKGTTVNLTPVVFGRTRLDGAISYQARTGRPKITAMFSARRLDIDDVRAAFRMLSAAAPKPALRPAVFGVGRFSPGIRPSEHRPRAGRGKPRTFGMLADADLDASIDVASTTIGGAVLSNVRLKLTSRDGNARIDLESGDVFGGRASAVAVVTSQDGTNRLQLSAEVASVDAAKVSAAFAKSSTIQGTGRLTAALTGAGATPAALIASLTGKTQIVINKGAVVGWDIPAIVREFERGRISKIRKIDSERTTFDKATATFAIANGKAVTHDLTLTGPLLEMTGAGTADLAHQQIDLLLKPKLIEGREKRGGARYLAGIALPIRISGDWKQPNVRLEAGDGWRDPEKRRQALGRLKRRFKGRNTEQIIRGLFRDGGNNDDARATKEILKDLFR